MYPLSRNFSSVDHLVPVFLCFIRSAMKPLRCFTSWRIRARCFSIERRMNVVSMRSRSCPGTGEDSEPLY